MNSTLMGYAQAATFLGICRSTLYAWVSQKRIPHVKFGPRCVRFDQEVLQDWIEVHHIVPGDHVNPLRG